MASAAIYCRVSTKEQTQNLSLSTQQKACEEYCERNGIEVVRVFVEEGESAKIADRTELQRLIHYCVQNKRLIDFVAVHNLSRFSRETRDHHALAATLAGSGRGCARCPSRSTRARSAGSWSRSSRPSRSATTT
jgi:DNA invertase Pin-like site-specific DNA recombinase